MRVNQQIRVSPIRLIDEEGNQIGIVPVDEAKNQAESAGLDLVEVSPNASPPVCRIMDYGKFKYEQAKREKEAHRKTKQSEVSLIRVRPRVGVHDFEVKLKHARRFLDEGHKVRIFVLFRSREFTHPELGRQLLERFIDALVDVASVEKPIGMEGRQMTVMLVPKERPS